MQKAAFLLQLLHFLFEYILYGHKFFILLDCVIESLFQQLIIQFFLLKQANELSVGFYLPASGFLILLLFLLIDVSNKVVNLHLIILLIPLQDFHHIWMFSDDNIFHLRKEVEVFLHFLALVLIVILFFDKISDELIDVLIAYFFLKAMQLIVHRRLRKILIFFESLHNRSEGFLLIMQVLSQIYNLVFKLAHSFMVKLFVLQSHLLLHQQSRIDIHVLVVVLSQFIGEFGLGVEQGQFCFVATHNCKEGLLVEGQVLLEVREIMVAFDSFSLQELYFVLLALVGREELLHIVDIAITHQIILKILSKPHIFHQIKRQPKESYHCVSVQLKMRLFEAYK